MEGLQTATSKTQQSSNTEMWCMLCFSHTIHYETYRSLAMQHFSVPRSFNGLSNPAKAISGINI